jgi:hypothetical protein
VSLDSPRRDLPTPFRPGHDSAIAPRRRRGPAETVVSWAAAAGSAAPAPSTDPVDYHVALVDHHFLGPQRITADHGEVADECVGRQRRAPNTSSRPFSMRPAVPEHSRYTTEDLLTFYKNPRFVDHRHSDAFAQVADRVGAYVEVTSPAASTGVHPFLLVSAGTPRTWTRSLRRGSAW